MGLLSSLFGVDDDDGMYDDNFTYDNGEYGDWCDEHGTQAWICHDIGLHDDD